MPNWCHNRVDLTHDDPEAVAALVHIFENPQPFAALMPEPDWRATPNDQGHLPGPRYGRWDCHRFPDGSADERWYSWRLAHWGVKWDLPEVDVIDGDAYGFRVEFETPWGPPEGICELIRSRGFYVSWLWDEPGMGQAGYL